MGNSAERQGGRANGSSSLRSAPLEGRRHTPPRATKPPGRWAVFLALSSTTYYAEVVNSATVSGAFMFPDTGKRAEPVSLAAWRKEHLNLAAAAKTRL